MTPGTGKFFPANNYHIHLFNNSYEFMNNENSDNAYAEDIVMRLRHWGAQKPPFRIAIDDEKLEFCIMEEAADKIERLRNDLTECENNFHTLKEMFDRMRADRDLWKEVAENLASELGKKEYAHAEYDTYKEVAGGVAW